MNLFQLNIFSLRKNIPTHIQIQCNVVENKTEPHVDCLTVFNSSLKSNLMSTNVSGIKYIIKQRDELDQMCQKWIKAVFACTLFYSRGHAKRAHMIIYWWKVDPCRPWVPEDHLWHGQVMVANEDHYAWCVSMATLWGATMRVDHRRRL